ncbi:MAG: hypothetical protein K2X27_13540 [Candidatus Obscuribacterales bacterium]|nr:hypothetical protein [Candidatus Obscuribacterales bacterium]
MIISSQSACSADLSPVKHCNLNFWLNYFESNRKLREGIALPGDLFLNEELKPVLLRSLQRFQIGESGDGKHLKKYALRVKDERYLRIINFFIKEEQEHGNLLAQVILSFDGSLLNFHWSALAFIFLRRIFALKTEILVLLIAEIIGKCFYRCLAERLPDERLRYLFALIVLDEVAHLEFHGEFLAERFQNYPAFLKISIKLLYSFVFRAALVVFLFDHAACLEALAVSKKEFYEQAFREFRRSLALIF